MGRPFLRFLRGFLGGRLVTGGTPGSGLLGGFRAVAAGRAPAAEAPPVPYDIATGQPLAAAAPVSPYAIAPPAPAAAPSPFLIAQPPPAPAMLAPAPVAEVSAAPPVMPTYLPPAVMPPPPLAPLLMGVAGPVAGQVIAPALGAMFGPSPTFGGNLEPTGSGAARGYGVEAGSYGGMPASALQAYGGFAAMMT